MRRLLCLTAAALVLAACEVRNFTGPSPLGDEQDVAITGTLLQPDGTPWVNGALTLNVAGGRAPKATTTGGDGGFLINLKGYETKNGFGEADYLRLAAQRPDGTQLLHSFQARQALVAVTPLKFWDGWTQPAAGATMDEELGFAWSQPDGGGFSWKLDLLRGDKVAWTLAPAEPAAVVRKQALDNGVAYRAQVFAQRDGLQLWSSRRDFTAPGDAGEKLISVREVKDDQGRTYPGLHDAELLGPAFMVPGSVPSPVPSGNPQALIVDLGAEVAVGRVLGFNFPGGVTTIQVSADGTSWGAASAGNALGATCFDVPLPGARGRYLKLASGGGGLLGHGAEIRVVAP